MIEKGVDMLSFRFEKTGDFGMLTFNGELTVQNVDRLKEALMVSLSNAEHVVVNFEKVSKIDEDCLCLFYSTSGILSRLKKHLTLIGVCPDTFKKVASIIECSNFINTVTKRDTTECESISI